MSILTGNSISQGVVKTTSVGGFTALFTAAAFGIMNPKPAEAQDAFVIDRCTLTHNNDGTTPIGTNVDVGPAFGLSYSCDAEKWGEKFHSEIGFEGFIGGPTRVDATERIDQIYGSLTRTNHGFQIGKGEGETQLGLGFQVFGDFGGDSIQNTVHTIVGDTLIHNPQYSGKYFGTPTIVAAGKYEYPLGDGKIGELSASLDGRVEIPLIPNNGIASAEANVRLNLDTNFAGINVFAGVGVDAVRYPNKDVFANSPFPELNGITPNAQFGIEKEFRNGNTVFLTAKVPLNGNDANNTMYTLGGSFNF